MVWHSASDFFQMGGYGLYVWGSVVVTFGVLLIEVVLTSHRRRIALRQLKNVLPDEGFGADEGASGYSGEVGKV